MHRVQWLNSCTRVQRMFYFYHKHCIMNYFRLVLLFVLPMASSAQSKNFLDVPYLETSAKVDTLVTPDKIYLNITIQEKDSKGNVRSDASNDIGTGHHPKTRLIMRWLEVL